MARVSFSQKQFLQVAWGVEYCLHPIIHPSLQGKIPLIAGFLPTWSPTGHRLLQAGTTSNFQLQTSNIQLLNNLLIHNSPSFNRSFHYCLIMVTLGETYLAQFPLPF